MAFLNVLNLSFDAFIFARKTNEMANIRRFEALKEMDVHETSSHGAKTFSLQFYKKNGELVYVNRAVSCGLKMDMKSNRMRGVQPVNENNKPVGHPYPVCIDNIREFNGQRVTF